MNIRRPSGLLLALALAPAPIASPLLAPPAHGETPDKAAESVQASLAELLSFASFGMISTQDTSAQVRQVGDDYEVTLPLKGMAVPANAAVTALARPAAGGAWDILSLAFPPQGTMQPMPRGAGQAAYSIGRQVVTAHIDPSFAQPSRFSAAFGDVHVASTGGRQSGEQSFDRYVIDGTLTGAPDGRINVASHGTANAWHMTAHGDGAGNFDVLTRLIGFQASVQGLDRAKGEQLREAVRALMASLPKPGDVSPNTESPNTETAQPALLPRQVLSAILDAVTGLMTKADMQETLDDIHVSAGPGLDGNLRHAQIGFSGGTRNDRFDASIDTAMDELTATAIPAAFKAYVPHHLALRQIATGLQTAPLLAILRAAAAENPDPAALILQVAALLNKPGAFVGIDPFDFDSGPLRVSGSARLLAHPDGQFGGHIHVSATGMDALVAQVQSQPAMQQAMPAIFLAKGMGRQEGSAMVWDIDVGDGPVRVNGAAVGQPAGARR